MGLVLLAACSGGGGGSAASTSTTTSTTSTTLATTTTLSQQEAVKAAYLAYWKMIDRLFVAPDPEDAELAARAGDPLLSQIKDQLSTKRSEGHSYKLSPDHPNDHNMSDVVVTGGSASLSDCYVDGRTEFDSAGRVVDDAVATKLAHVALKGEGTTWRVNELQFVAESPGVSGCAA